jgi:hypothetical protein
MLLLAHSTVGRVWVRLVPGCQLQLQQQQHMPRLVCHLQVLQWARQQQHQQLWVRLHLLLQWWAGFGVLC